MRNRIAFCAIQGILWLAILTVAGAAFGQADAAAADSSIWLKVVGAVIAGLSLIGGSSIVSAFVRSEGGPVRTAVMRLIDALAFNWLRARNDPAVNQPPASG